MGFCDNANNCGQSCSTAADCPMGSACTSGHPECGGNVCLDYTGCGSSGSRIRAVRGALPRSMQDARAVGDQRIALVRNYTVV
jgi:hypothetical protein